MESVQAMKEKWKRCNYARGKTDIPFPFLLIVEYHMQN